MRKREITPAHLALRRIRPGTNIVASPYCATRETLLRELGTLAEHVDGLR